MDPKNLSRVDLEPAPEDFLGDVIKGFSGTPKSLSPKYCYDAIGSRYFNEITQLEEYYPTRTELSIIDGLGDVRLGNAGQLAVIELGGASSFKLRRLMPCLSGLRMCVPVDISRTLLFEEAAKLAKDHPALQVLAICADYQQLLSFSWQDHLRGLTPVIFFPGSTIGNLDENEALALLRMCRQVTGEGGYMLLGVDLLKSTSVILPAYDDSKGANARFNLNVLHRINRELGGDIDVANFRHDVRFDRTSQRIDIHLVAKAPHLFQVAGRHFRFDAGEAMHVESSRKFERRDLEALAERTGFRCARWWTDSRRYYAMVLLEAAPGAGRSPGAPD